ncbi:hypothetical protein DSO57_1002305 [Entomophthora muscae]|uniref:Uncharacterized protein n=1 Tax=Entomophthora muscae TaxID=34485 RepID=A0ACC2UIA8_9FUNG|nr:hypothetical protein DSO57_1002305 [Entomophthora muscae]
MIDEFIINSNQTNQHDSPSQRQSSQLFDQNSEATIAFQEHASTSLNQERLMLPFDREIESFSRQVEIEANACPARKPQHHFVTSPISSSSKRARFDSTSQLSHAHSNDNTSHVF